MSDFPKRYYGFIALTGGEKGCLDNIPGTNLIDQDFAFGTYQGKILSYILDVDSGLDESPPDIIAPDVDAGDKRWILKYSKQIAQNVEVTDANNYWNVSNSEDIFDQIGNYTLNRVSKGWYTGGVVTCDTGALTVDVTSGTGNWAGTRNVSWDAASNVAITADALNYIYVDTADSTVKNTTTKAIADAQIPLAIVLANATEAIKISPYKIEISDFHYQVHEYLKRVIGPVCETGMSVSINTPSDLNIVVDTGAFHWGLSHYEYTTESPCSFTYWHKVTDGGTTRWVKTTSQTSINNTKYNLNTAGDWSYADLDGNKYRKDLICVAPKTDGSLVIAVILGQEQFSNLSDARNGAIPTLGDLELMGFASLAYVIIKQGASSIAEVGDMRPLLGQYGAMQDHGSLTGLSDNDHPQYMLVDSPKLGDDLDAQNHSIYNVLGIGTGAVSAPVVRAATLVVAANDSSTKSKAQADYICDGVDDQVEIQAAIDALPAQGGKVLLLEGTYLTKSPIDIKADSIHLTGVSASMPSSYGTRIQADAGWSGNYIIEVAESGGEVRHPWISDLSLDGGSETSIGGILLHRVYDGVIIKNLGCRNFDKNVIRLEAVTAGVISQSIWLENILSIANKSATAPSVWIEDTNEVMIVSSKFFGNDGVGGKSNTNGIEIKGLGDANRGVYRVTLIGNSFAHYSGAGIKLDSGTYNCLIQSNTIEGLDDGVVIGDIGTGTLKANVIRDNRYKTITNDAIKVQRAAGTIIEEWYTEEANSINITSDAENTLLSCFEHGDVWSIIDNGTRTHKFFGGIDGKFDLTSIAKIGATTISAAQWGYLGAMDQGVATEDSVQFSGLKISSNYVKFQLNCIASMSDETSRSLEAYVNVNTGILFVADTGFAHAFSGIVYLEGNENHVTILLDPMDKIRTTDTDGYFCVLADGDTTYTVKNRLGHAIHAELMAFGRED